MDEPTDGPAPNQKFVMRGLLSPKARAFAHVKGKTLSEKMAHVRAHEESRAKVLTFRADARTKATIRFSS